VVDLCDQLFDVDVFTMGVRLVIVLAHRSVDVELNLDFLFFDSLVDEVD
jgi:hypothetical protein